MKVPLVYPKIPSPTGCPLKQCIAFEKLDGTNIHLLFKRDTLTKHGVWRFSQFGTRRDRFDNDEEFETVHPNLYGVLGFDLYGLMDYEYVLSNKRRFDTAQEIILFTEFCGSQSFAGSHKSDDDKSFYLIDVQVDGVMLPPEEFLEEFAIFADRMPKVIFKGKYTGQLVEDIRNGKYPVKEGAVIKGVIGGQVHMTKVKTNTYMEKLKSEFKDDWENYWE